MSIGVQFGHADAGWRSANGRASRERARLHKGDTTIGSLSKNAWAAFLTGSLACSESGARSSPVNARSEVWWSRYVLVIGHAARASHLSSRISSMVCVSPFEGATPQQDLFLNVLVVASDGNGVHDARNERRQPHADALLRMLSRNVAAPFRSKLLICHACCGVAGSAGGQPINHQRSSDRARLTRRDEVRGFAGPFCAP
jgi:hypothetical protein